MIIMYVWDKIISKYTLHKQIKLLMNGHPMISHKQGSYTEWFMR